MDQIKHENIDNSVLKTYTICQQIGQGASSRVYKAFDSVSKNYYAIKAIPKQYLDSDPKLMEFIKTQIYILKTCNNRNVLKCYQVFHSPHSIFIVTQLCDGSMQSRIQKQTRFSEDQAIMYLKQILNGFRGLHDVGAMHRDFKLANVLLHKQICKIGDFGYAKRMNQSGITYTLLGTKITMAPQVIERKGYGFSADIWSLGVVFYQMIYGQYPFSGPNQKQILRKIKTFPINFSLKRISPEARDFISRCLTYNPLKRITWSQIYNHPLLNRSNVQILYNIWNPKQKLNQNSKFYNEHRLEQQNTSFSSQSQNQNSLIILRDSNRKKLVMKQIQEVISRKLLKRDSECSKQIYLKNVQVNKQVIILKCAHQYIVYLNKLSYPLKFLRQQLIKSRYQRINKYTKYERQNLQKIQNTSSPQYLTVNNLDNNSRGRSSNKLNTPNKDIKHTSSSKGLFRNCFSPKHSKNQETFTYTYTNTSPSSNNSSPYGKSIKVQIQSLLYLIFKRSYCQLMEYSKIIKNFKNIFKITTFWQELCNSVYYKQILDIINYQVQKAEKIVSTLQQKASWSIIQDISEQATKKVYSLEKIKKLCQKYLTIGVKEVFYYFRECEAQNDKQYENFIQFMQGLLYTLSPDEEDKITPEQFHFKISNPFNFLKARKDLIERYEIFFKNY